MHSSTEKLTAVEVSALDVPYNLADAHVHQMPSPLEMSEIVQKFPDIYIEASTRTQSHVDRAALLAFTHVSGQRSVHASTWFLPVYSSSIATEIVANVMRELRMSVALVEPTFDNIADILKRNRVRLRSILLNPGEAYVDAVLDALGHGTNAIYLVLPNNPTGHLLSRADLDRIAVASRDRGVVLILDVSFRLHDDAALYDQYEILDGSGVEYIVIEDTGKIWPTLDLKLSFILASDRFRPPITNVHNDILLNVSPFVSVLVERYSNFSRIDGLRSIRKVLEENRTRLRVDIKEAFGEAVIPFPDSRVGVEFIRVPVRRAATDLARDLKRQGIAVLSGRPFYWAHSEVGEGYLRIALARSPDYFAKASEQLVAALVRLGSGDHGRP